MRGDAMKMRIVAGLLLALAMAVGGVGSVSADQPSSPPGQGECDHGNSLQSCKPDPQPSSGQDCLDHGPNDGGVNEDHCTGGAPSSEPSSEPSFEPSTPPSVEPSVTPSESPSPSASTTATPSASTGPLTSSSPRVPSVSVTPPPTDAQASSATPSRMNWLLMAIIALAAGVVFASTLRPKRHR